MLMKLVLLGSCEALQEMHSQNFDFVKVRDGVAKSEEGMVRLALPSDASHSQGGQILVTSFIGRLDEYYNNRRDPGYICFGKKRDFRANADISILQNLAIVSLENYDKIPELTGAELGKVAEGIFVYRHRNQEEAQLIRLSLDKRGGTIEW